jgi:hypothetical protein
VHPILLFAVDSIGWGWTLGLVATLFVPVYIAYKLSDRAHVRSRKRWIETQRSQHRLPDRSAPPPSTELFGGKLIVTGSGWGGSAGYAAISLLFLAGLIFWRVAPRKTPPPGPAPVPAGVWVLIALAVVVLGLVAWVVVQWLRYRDPLLTQAGRLAREGDRDAAIALLTEAMDVKPTAYRANNLASLLINKKDWPGAYKRLLQAQELGLPGWIAESNLCVVLRDLGRFNEALDLIGPQALKPRASFAQVCNYCQALIDAGRLDDAWDQIGRAETMLARNQVGVYGAGHQLREALDRCRTRYEERAGLKKAGPAPDLDELV